MQRNELEKISSAMLKNLKTFFPNARVDRKVFKGIFHTIFFGLEHKNPEEVVPDIQGSAFLWFDGHISITLGYWFFSSRDIPTTVSLSALNSLVRRLKPWGFDVLTSPYMLSSSTATTGTLRIKFNGADPVTFGKGVGLLIKSMKIYNDFRKEARRSTRGSKL